MSRVARSAPALAAVLLLGLVAGCQKQPTGASFGWKPVFGDLAKDNTPVIVQVGTVGITEADLEQFIDEQPSRQKEFYVGPEGERLALQKMIEQALMVQGAVERKLYNDQRVARTLVTQRRLMLDRAMRQVSLLKDKQPSEEQLQEYFRKNSANYTQEATVHARHIECLSRDAADRAYWQLKANLTNDAWVKMCAEVSVNEKSKAVSGDLGWMDENTPVAYIEAGAGFAKAAVDLRDGLNPPIRVGDRWHVVQITEREAGRPATFAEARDQVRNEYLPEFQDAIIQEYLKGARAKYGVTYQGRFAPGKGVSAQQLYERAMLTNDPQRRAAVLVMIADEYPESDRADDALFLAANTLMEGGFNVVGAGDLLRRLVRDYPQSEMVDDAKFLLDHLHEQRKINPKTIQELVE